MRSEAEISAVVGGLDRVKTTEISNIMIVRFKSTILTILSYFLKIVRIVDTKRNKSAITKYYIDISGRHICWTTSSR